MWPFKKSKNAEKAAAQPRTDSGKFAAPPAAQEAKTAAQAVEAEGKLFSSLAQGMDALDNLIERREARLAAMAGPDTDGVPEMSAVGEFLNSPVAAVIAPVIAPYLPGLIEKYLGVQPVAVAASGRPQTSPSGATPEEHNAVMAPESAPEASPGALSNSMLIKTAAGSPPKLIKPMLPRVFAELEKQGITRDEFKQAVTNLNKAMA